MRHCVFIIEDDDDIATLLSMLFGSEGYAVRWAATLAEAREILASGLAPTVVLLDVVLPDGDGITLCPVIRQRYPDVPILVVTARPDARTRAAAQTAGCPDVLAKPFDPDALLATVKALIGSP